MAFSGSCKRESVCSLGVFHREPVCSGSYTGAHFNTKSKNNKSPSSRKKKSNKQIAQAIKASNRKSLFFPAFFPPFWMVLQHSQVAPTDIFVLGKSP